MKRAQKDLTGRREKISEKGREEKRRAGRVADVRLLMLMMRRRIDLQVVEVVFFIHIFARRVLP